LIPIQVKHLIAGYESKSLIRNLSFSVTHPSFVAIVGHNGSGKTTLLKAITQQIPIEGKIFVGGQELSPGSNPSARGLLTVLSQKNSIGFSITVQDLVVMGRFRHKRFFQGYDARDYQLAAEVMQQLGIGHIAGKKFSELSGGEQQMVWLAQMMVQDAQVYLLDEPTQQLDLYNKKRVFELMNRWVQENNKTVLCITHDLHYLAGREGFILNISAQQLGLEPLSDTTIRKHIEILEQKPPH
jgi:iron complex transport system ATP-binding protein